MLVIIIIMQLGFFKRQKHEDLKQRREDAQNLTDNGMGPGGAGSTENMLDGGAGGAGGTNL